MSEPEYMKVQAFFTRRSITAVEIPKNWNDMSNRERLDYVQDAATREYKNIQEIDDKDLTCVKPTDLDGWGILSEKEANFVRLADVVPLADTYIALKRLCGLLGDVNSIDENRQ